MVIARPTGIYGPGDRRLLKLFRGVARRRFVILGDGEIFYHLTYIDDLVEGFRLCGDGPGGRGTHLHSGRRGSHHAERADRIDRRGGAACAPPRVHLPVWPFWIAGALCEAVCAPFGIEPPLYRRRVDFFTKSRAFDISRARAELGYAPQIGLRDGIRRTLAWYQTGWLDRAILTFGVFELTASRVHAAGNLPAAGTGSGATPGPPRRGARRRCGCAHAPGRSLWPPR